MALGGVSKAIQCDKSQNIVNISEENDIKRDFISQCTKEKTINRNKQKTCINMIINIVNGDKIIQSKLSYQLFSYDL